MGIQVNFRFRRPVTEEELVAVGPYIKRMYSKLQSNRGLTCTVFPKRLLIRYNDEILDVVCGDVHPFWRSYAEYQAHIGRTGREPRICAPSCKEGDLMIAALMLLKMVKGESMELCSEFDGTFRDALLFMRETLDEDEILGFALNPEDAWKSLIRPCEFTEEGLTYYLLAGPITPRKKRVLLKILYRVLTDDLKKDAVNSKDAIKFKNAMYWKMLEIMSGKGIIYEDSKEYKIFAATRSSLLSILDGV